jgi:NitT/TauT family transport system substrate-binding protein
MPLNLPRRRALGLGLTALLQSACSDGVGMPLRFGAHPWPGYEFLYLARERGYLASEQVRLIETPSASASLRGLANHMLEGAALTLDEVLTAHSRGVALVVVAVVDVSMGADVVLLRPHGSGRQTLAGRTVGIEPSATAAVMLASTLVRGMGAAQIFSSAEIPGRIVDTLALRPDVLQQRPAAVQALVAAHFQALAEWRSDPVHCAPVIAPRLQLPPLQVPAAFSLLQLPDARMNQAWLRADGGSTQLQAMAQALMRVMVAAHLLPKELPLERLADGRFLP